MCARSAGLESGSREALDVANSGVADAVRYGLRPGRPIWTEGYDKRFCFDEMTLANRVRYVLRHNEAMGWGMVPTPWQSFVAVPPQLAPGH